MKWAKLMVEYKKAGKVIGKLELVYPDLEGEAELEWFREFWEEEG